MMRPLKCGVAVLLVALGTPACSGRAAQTATPFAALIDSLSEPGGFFDTDNLISNESSYLHVIDRLHELGVSGGAYIGVGPDQNFSYIAAVRPDIAYIVDIRRDNMLQHLIFKALFELADTRVGYLSLLFGRPPPEDARAWMDSDVTELVAYIDTTPPVHAADARRLVDARIRTFGVRLSESDWATIDRFHRTFIEAGLSLRFRTFGRAPRYYYPTYRDLVLERTRSGQLANYLAVRSAFRAVKALQDADRIVPVVGDLAGGQALPAIARHIADAGNTVSVYYTSNVEYYLFRNNTYTRFLDNVRKLPAGRPGVIIRSVFQGPFGPHPLAVPGYYSTQLLQRLDELAAGRFTSYWEVVTARPMN